MFRLLDNNNGLMFLVTSFVVGVHVPTPYYSLKKRGTKNIIFAVYTCQYQLYDLIGYTCWCPLSCWYMHMHDFVFRSLVQG